MSYFHKAFIDNFPGVIIGFNLSTKRLCSIEGKGKAQLFANLHERDNLSLAEFRSCIADSHRESIAEQTQSLLTHKKNWSVEYPIKHAADEFWLREESFYGHNEQTTENQLGLIITDITKQKRQQQNLERDIESAKHTANTKNEFFASMSHEIRTPMNAVMGMAQILAKTALDSEQKQYVKTIMGSSNALVQIINDILDLSKLEAGKLDITQDKVDLESLCLEVCQLLTARAQDKGLQLLLDYQITEVDSVIADKGRLRQILINLIGNAIKFTEQGYVCLQVSLEKQKDKSVFQFSVKDTGIGISEDDLPNVFDSFYRIPSGKVHNVKGLGLGLSYVKYIITQLNGNIQVKSKPGSGTRFEITLPLKDD